MEKALTLSVLQSAVTGTAAAFRSRTTMQPAGGEGTKVFPPTYAGAVYATEKRRLPECDQPVDCVLLDSVQSQANRMEEALQQAIDAGRLSIPLIEVDFTPYHPGKDQSADKRLLDPVGKVSSLQAPHRIADAILRDSLLSGKPFRQSDQGRRINSVNSRDATALFELCPTALIFGMWDSTGPKRGLGAKFERALVSEIVGINATYGVKTSSRIDPLGVQLKAGPLFATANGGGISWTLEELEARKEKNKPVVLGKDGRPSEANHGNVTPSLSERDRNTGEYLAGGVTIASAEQTIVMSLPALRRLRFPIGGRVDSKVDDAARTVLAALGLCAAALSAEAGQDLRSRCLLWPETELKWTLLDRKHGGDFLLPADAAVNLLNESVEAATRAGLAWPKEPLVLTPSDQLLKLVIKSQSLAMQQGDEGGE